MKKGEVTAFLSLIFILLLSTLGGIVESASIQLSKNQRRGDVDIAMESVFAEYQRNLLEKYDVFALEGTYETGEFSEENLIERLKFYGVKNAEQDIEAIQFLTDDSGRAFREQVIAYMKQKTGVSLVEEISNLSEKWKEPEKVESPLGGVEEKLPEENNPIADMAQIEKTGLLNYIVKNQSEISKKYIQRNSLPSQRALRKGRGMFKVRNDTSDALSKIYFGEYMLEKFAAADKPNETGKLSYELEYIIGGKASDRENLETVVRRLTAVRFGPNYSYMQQDEAKKTKAGALALLLSSIIAMPEAKEPIEQAILMAWAFKESMLDVRKLLEGGKVPLEKQKEDSEAGLSYREYLRMLLFLKSREDCTMRSLDVVEMNMQTAKGEFFRLDNCISKLKVRSVCQLRRGISYEFNTMYGYQ